jgi:hypothetical protein
VPDQKFLSLFVPASVTVANRYVHLIEDKDLDYVMARPAFPPTIQPQPAEQQKRRYL